MKKLTFAALFVTFSLAALGQGLPLEKNTNKVTYAGAIELPGMKAGQIADKALTWFSSETRFRGHFGPVIEVANDMTILTTVNLSITRMVKAYVWTLNAAVILEYADGELSYKITDFYTYGSASFLILYVDDVTDSPLEFNKYFNIMDIESTNENARNLDREITNLIDLLQDYMKG